MSSSDWGRQPPPSGVPGNDRHVPKMQFFLTAACVTWDNLIYYKEVISTMLCYCKCLKCLVYLNTSIRALVRQRTDRTSAEGKTAKAGQPDFCSSSTGSHSCLDSSWLPWSPANSSPNHLGSAAGSQNWGAETVDCTCLKWARAETRNTHELWHHAPQPGVLKPTTPGWRPWTPGLMGGPHKDKNAGLVSVFTSSLIEYAFFFILSEDNRSCHWMQKRMISTLDL